MNHREPTSVPRGTGQALPCLALLLLPLLALSRAWSRPNVQTPVSIITPSGYLLAVGAPALRFLDAAPPPDLVARPPAAAPPKLSDEESATRPDVIVYTPPGSSSSQHTPGDSEPATADASEAEGGSSQTARSPVPILRDEFQRHTRPEDVLPYFQIPASYPDDVNLMLPANRGSNPPPLPQSSATYTQSPR